MCLRCLCFRFPFPFAESPWGLPVVADGPASLAKAVMAELAGLKLENKPWPGGKALPACWRNWVVEARSPQPAEGHIRNLGVWGTGSGRGDSARVGDTEAEALPARWPLGSSLFSVGFQGCLGQEPGLQRAGFSGSFPPSSFLPRPPLPHKQQGDWEMTSGAFLLLLLCLFTASGSTLVREILTGEQARAVT